MSKIRQMLIFLSLLGIFFAALSIHIRPKRNQFQFCRPQKVKDIRFTTPSAELLTYRDEDKDSWYVEKNGISRRADDRTTNTLLTVLCYLPYTEQLEIAKNTSQEELNAYGVSAPQYRLSVQTSTGHFSLDFGALVPSGTEYYMQASTHPQLISLIANSFRDALFPEFMDLIQRVPFAEIELAEWLNLDFGGLSLKMQNSGHGWNEIREVLHNDATQELVNIVLRLNFINFIGPLTQKEKLYYGLDFAEVTLQWQKKGERAPQTHQVLFFGTRHYLTLTMGKDLYLLVLESKSAMNFFANLRQLAVQLQTHKAKM